MAVVVASEVTDENELTRDLDAFEAVYKANSSHLSPKGRNRSAGQMLTSELAPAV